MSDPIAGIMALRSYGEVAAVSRDNPALVCAYGPERNREVLSNPDGFRHDEGFIDGPPGSSLARMRQVIVAINGDLHRRHRRLMAPAFTRAALRSYGEQTVAVTERMVERWPRDQPVDLDALLRDVALCMAVRTLYGLDLEEGASELGHLAARFVEYLTHPLAILLPYDVPGSPYRRSLRLGASLLARLEALVEEKRSSGEPGQDALSRLLRAAADDDSGFTDEELLAEAVTLFIAGHETTAKTLSWTSLLLERHPDVLAAVLEELDGVLGGRSMTVDDIERLPLLDRVIKESMRVLPPVPMLFLRVPVTEMPLGTRTLPKGANVVISPFATHHDPELYPEPRRFRPERWEGHKPSTYEYLPFGAGPRTCIGASFAMQALRLILPTVLQRVRFSVVAGARIARFTRANIMMLRHGLPVRLEAPHRRRLEPAAVRGDVHEMVELA